MIERERAGLPPLPEDIRANPLPSDKDIYTTFEPRDDIIPRKLTRSERERKVQNAKQAGLKLLKTRRDELVELVDDYNNGDMPGLDLGKVDAELSEIMKEIVRIKAITVTDFYGDDYSESEAAATKL